MSTDPLAKLRDYHLPPPISWWPPAPGWWGLLLLLLSISIFIAIWWYQRRRQAAAIHARAELLILQTELAANGNAVHFMRELSKLLRRFALTRFPRHQIAGLTNTEWLKFLDAHGGQGRFSTPGQLLLIIPYQADHHAIDSKMLTSQARELASIVDAWISYNKFPHRKR